MPTKRSPIHIKESREGTFTEWAKRHGYSSTQQAARAVLAHPDKYPPSIVKKANFARNSAKWSHK